MVGSTDIIFIDEIPPQLPTLTWKDEQEGRNLTINVMLDTSASHLMPQGPRTNRNPPFIA